MSSRLKRYSIFGVAALLLVALALLTTFFGGILGGGEGPGPGRPDGGATGSFSGRVLSGDGQPAPEGVRVTARGGRSVAVTSTDASGRFSFDILPEGTTSLAASLGPLTAESPATATPLDLRLSELCTLAGRVVDKATAEPVRLAVIRCGDEMVQTGPRGSFRFEGFRVPDARPPLLDVSAPGYRRLTFRPPLTGGWDDLFLRMESR
jgi:hypothetical protein